MNLSQFRKSVFSEFGPNMENATPANVREFLERVQKQAHEENEAREGRTGPLRIDEHADSWEQILREFFSQTLRMPSDEAIITLWTMAVEMSFQALESHYADAFRPLFPDHTPD